MDHPPARLALVTGASSGIGLELARHLAADGCDVVLIARRLDRLKALSEELVSKHGVSVHILALDLSAPRAVNEVIEFLDTRQLEVHTLINNAGFGLVGRFHEIDRQAQLDLIQVNVTVPADLTRCLLPGMVERGEGRVLNVASSSAFQPASMVGLYHASKAFVLFLTEAIAEEVRGTGVTATALCPGPVGQTEFGDRLGPAGKVPGLNFIQVSARDVARIGLAGMRRGKTIVVPGFWMKLNSVITPRLPRWFVRKTIHMLQRSRV